MSISSRLAFSLFFLAGLVMIYHASKDILTQLGPGRWQTTTGIVTSCEITAGEERVGGGSYYDKLDGTTRREGDPVHQARRQVFYDVEVAYRFQIDGREYQDRTVADTFDDASSAEQARVQNYPIGTRLVVLYNPRDPSEHSINESVTGKVFGLFVFVLIGFVFAAILPVGEYLAYRSRRDDHIA